MLTDKSCLQDLGSKECERALIPGCDHWSNIASDPRAGPMNITILTTMSTVSHLPICFFSYCPIFYSSTDISSSLVVKHKGIGNDVCKLIHKVLEVIPAPVQIFKYYSKVQTGCSGDPSLRSHFLSIPLTLFSQKSPILDRPIKIS